MKALIDTNILIDVLANRKGLSEGSSIIFKLCEIGRLEGTVSSNSILDLIYILRKQLNKETTLQLIAMLSAIFNIGEVGRREIKEAINLDFDDFEDAIQCSVGIRNKVDYIISRNKNGFINSPIEVLTPEEYLLETTRGNS